MKNTFILSILIIATFSIFTGCGKDDDPAAQIECNTFDQGKNAILDAQESDLKCVYAVGTYTSNKAPSGEDLESLDFKLNQDFYVTFYNYEVSYENNTSVFDVNGIFEVGGTYEADARTGNATFFSPATLEITSIDKENELISGKITSQAPIRWVDATPVMGYVIFTFVDLKI